jgi:4-amino-4-deoxy-L-arabinose transferase-like glycosyltransferase
MATPSTTELNRSSPYLLPLCLTAVGLLARLAWAHSVFLNPDEALHYLISTNTSLAETYRGTLSTAHPPLLIVLLHYWSWFGTSEFVLRLPSVFAGTAFCWMMFLWLGQVTDRQTALIGLSLLLFCPALICGSAEIRQYALLHFFCACCLYCLERALEANSPEWMLLSFLSLYLALSTHYSALIFALAAGVYALLRFRPGKAAFNLFAVWIAGQVVALALVAFYWKTQVIPLKHSGLTQTLADSYLRGSVFHSGEDRVVPFIVKSNIKVFHYLFSQGAMGVLGLVLFVTGVVILFRSRSAGPDSRKAAPWQLGLFLVLPFIVNCAAAVAGAYPYGGTRHNSYLAGFAMSGVAIAVARWSPSKSWVKPAAIAAGLAICNFTVLPAGVYMKPWNQRITHMKQAMDFINTAVPAGSVVVSDLEGGLVLDYYLCHSYAPQSRPFQPFSKTSCASYQMFVQDPRLWIFRAPAFPAEMQTLQKMYGLEAGTKVWFFQAGFVVDKEPELRALLRERYRCVAPHEFGQNIFLCEINVAPTGN